MLFTGAGSQQALAAATGDRSSAAAAAASSASMFGSLSTQQLPQQSPRLSSIQLLHLRAQQHMAHANTPSAALSASVSSANSQAPLGEPPTQTHLQSGSLQSVYAPAGVRSHADAAMQALLDRLSQERNVDTVLPSIPAVAGPLPPAPGPPSPAAVWPTPAAPQPPPASRLASLTLVDGVAEHGGVGSSLTQQSDR